MEMTCTLFLHFLVQNEKYKCTFTITSLNFSTGYGQNPTGSQQVMLILKVKLADKLQTYAIIEKVPV